MATVILSSAFNSDNFWATRTGAAIIHTATTYEFQNSTGLFVKVTGTGLTYSAGDDPLGGTYTAIEVSSDASFTALTKVAGFTSATAIPFAIFFSSGAATALAGGDLILDSGGNDTVFGHDGNDNLISGGGADSLNGGNGNDSYSVGNGDSVVEAPNGGTDTVSSSTIGIDLKLAAFANVENAELTGTTAGLNAAGTDGANRLSGEQNSKANVLTGRGGNDVYFVGADDSVVETTSGGVDVAVSSSVSIDLATAGFANVENAQLNGAAVGLKLFGSDGANALFGETSTAANVLTGRGGNDTYVVGSGDSVVETGNGGTDIAISSTVSIDLGSAKFANVENVELDGALGIAAAGSSGANRLFGETNSAANVLTGRGGNDVYFVGAGDSVVEASNGGNDVAISSTVKIDLGSSKFKNVESAQLDGGVALAAFGSSGANTLFGETNSAANVLTGRGGNDTYIVGKGDSVVETNSGGLDLAVSSSVSIDLGSSKFANVENVELGGSKTLRALGSGGSNTFFAEFNSAANVLTGRGGNDTYFVGKGDSVVETKTGGTDVAISSTVSIDLGSSKLKNVENVQLGGSKALSALGSSAANVLFGETNTAANELTGRAGDDTYVVGKGDRVAETKTGGIDTAVSSSVSIDLGSSAFKNVEIVRLEGTKGLAAFGSSGADTLYGDGNSAGNVLTGRGGNDVYVVGKGDKVVEAANGGTDAVYSAALTIDLGSTKLANIEDAGLLGTKSLGLVGDDGANRLTGNAGANTIEGGKGLDVLSGLGGDDVFVFHSTGDSGLTNDTRDVILDFTHLSDRMDLSAIDADVKHDGDQAFTFLDGRDARFTGHAGQLHYLKAGDNTLVEADTNGDGKGDFQLLLLGLKTLTATDFAL